VYFRLAHIAALEGNAADMEKHLLTSIKLGMDLNVLLQDQINWHKFAQDQRLTSTLHSIFVLMASEELWQQLMDAPSLLSE
jgi:hypothetical protein